MTRRIVSVLAAAFMLLAGSLVWAQPAQAAPNGPCSIEEWQNPTSFVDCGKRLGQSAAAATGCVTAPTPGSPTSGMAGWFTTRPESSLRDGVSGLYSDYGVGGYGLDTYDLGCLGSVKHPDLTMWNTAASVEFSFAAAIMGAANWLREKAYDPGSMWDWSDGFVRSTTEAIYRWIFTPFGGIMLMIVGCYLLWRAKHGHASEALQVAAWAILVMVAVTGLARYPVEAAHRFDSGASAGLAAVHKVLGPAPQDIPADQCVLGGAACKDNRTVATRASDVAVQAIMYRNWLRAMLGDADSPTARKYGHALYDATTLSWPEAERAAQNPTLRKQLIDQKAATFNSVAQQIQAEDPAAYEYLQGVHGSDRFGAGVVALLSAVSFAFFDVSASIVILVAFLIFRVAVVSAPLLGTYGVHLRTSSGVRRVFHMSVAAFVNVIVFGAWAGVYLSAVDWIFRSPLPGVGQLVAVAIAGGLSFVLLKPARRLTHTVTGRARSEASLGKRLIGAGKDVYDIHTADEPGPRPELRTLGAVGAAVAPSVASTASRGHTAVAGNPYVQAAAGALRDGQRPEGRGAQAKAVVGAVVTVAATAAGGPAAGAATAAATSRRPEPRSKP